MSLYHIMPGSGKNFLSYNHNIQRLAAVNMRAMGIARKSKDRGNGLDSFRIED